MGLFDSARRNATPDDGGGDTNTTDDHEPEPRTTPGTPSKGSVATNNNREITVPIAGEDVTVEVPETKQTTDSGSNWLTSSKKYGRPRGVDAVQNRQIVQTSAMQSIVNGIAGQILGGELTFEGRDDVLDNLSESEQAAADDLRGLLRDVLEGPHLPDRSLDQMMVAAVEEMMGVGQAVWQPLPSEDGNIPVAALQGLDPLTVRMNINEHNEFRDPPYWQARGAFSDGQASNMASLSPVPLGHEDVILLDWPYGTRDYRTYPVSPAYQVREWLEVLANSTTHHNRFYDDNEIPPGLLQVVNASDQTVKDIREKIEQASGDPRDMAVVGGEGGAQWIEMGGGAINLNIIEEQKWFFNMCLGALGLGKAEVGLIEDVNRSNGEVEATRVYKRVGGPVSDQFERALLQVCTRFDAYRDLGKPFLPKLSYTDPREERAKEERLRKQLEAGAITPRQYARRTGNADIAEDDDHWQVTVGGTTVNYGDHPQWVAKRLMSAAGATDPEQGGGGE